MEPAAGRLQAVHAACNLEVFGKFGMIISNVGIDNPFGNGLYHLQQWWWLGDGLWRHCTHMNAAWFWRVETGALFGMDPSRPIQVLCSASLFYRGQAACDFSSEGLGSFVDEITTMSISYKWANFQFIIMSIQMIIFNLSKAGFIILIQLIIFNLGSLWMALLSKPDISYIM